MTKRNLGMRFGGPITPVVKTIMILNGVIFVIQKISGFIAPGQFESIFGLSHIGLIYEFKLWQIFTYMFLHGNFFHILFNLIGLWMFAGELELLWGRKIFINYYITCGIGAGLFIALMNFFIFSKYQINPITIGASGAIYALLLTYGILWPNRLVYIYGLLPIKMKYLVAAYGCIEFFGTIFSSAGGGNISHIGHLGGLISGAILFLAHGNRSSENLPGNSFFKGLFRRYKLKNRKKHLEDRIKAKEIIDRLLEKIAREGMSSLTSSEKKELEWARKHYASDGNYTLH